MPVTNVLFLCVAFCGALWPPGHVDAQLNFTHNLTHGGDENGFALPDEDVTVQCIFKDDQLDSYLFIHIPGILNCLACSVSDLTGSVACDGKVDRYCVEEDGFLNATLVVFSGNNTFGTYSCLYMTSKKTLTISQRYAVESIVIGLADDETPIITPDGTLKLECTTNCPVAPEPLFAWSGQTESDNITAVELPCISQPQDTVAGSQLTIGWQQINNPTNNITYECCETGGNLCDTLNITHAAVKATEVIIESDRETILYKDQYLILNCTTDCPLAPLPQLKWLNETDNNTDIVECGRDVRYLSVLTHLNVSWTEPEDGDGMDIEYICCIVDGSICTSISVTHMTGSPPTSTVSQPTTTSEPNFPHIPTTSSCSTGCIAGAAGAACAGLVIVIVILVCCCHERCPCYTWCRHPKPEDALPPTTEMYNRPVNDTAHTSETKLA